MRRKRIRVLTQCVANAYTGPDERIVEFSSPNGGGLISFRMQDDKLRVQIYRVDRSVEVLPTPPPD